MTLEQLTKKEAELRDQLTALTTEYQQAVIDRVSDNKRIALKKKISELRDDLADTEILSRAARKAAAEAARASDLDAQRQAYAAARVSLAGIEKKATALQAAVEAFAKAYTDCNDAMTAARSAFRAAGLKQAQIGTTLSGSIDTAVFVEMARFGVAHLAQVPITGVQNYQPMPAGIAHRIKRVERFLTQAEQAHTKPAQKQTTVAELHARVAAG